VRALREPQPRLWLLYAAVIVLGAYTQLTMLFVVAGQFIVYLIAVVVRRKRDWPGRWAGLWLGFTFGGLLTFQLYALMLPQMLVGLPQAGLRAVQMAHAIYRSLREGREVPV
jgi:hypothetical protein